MRPAFRARMFAPSLGIYEDPATGAAAAAFAGVLLRFARPADGRHDVVIKQGCEMKRPGSITLSITVSDHQSLARLLAVKLPSSRKGA